MTTRDLIPGTMIHLDGRDRLIKSMTPAANGSIRLRFTDGQVTLPAGVLITLSR